MHNRRVFIQPSPLSQRGVLNNYDSLGTSLFGFVSLSNRFSDLPKQEQGGDEKHRNQSEIMEAIKKVGPGTHDLPEPRILRYLKRLDPKRQSRNVNGDERQCETVARHPVRKLLLANRIFALQILIRPFEFILDDFVVLGQSECPLLQLEDFPTLHLFCDIVKPVLIRKVDKLFSLVANKLQVSVFQNIRGVCRNPLIV